MSILADLMRLPGVATIVVTADGRREIGWAEYDATSALFDLCLQRKEGDRH